ncbi:MAG: HRDC domain-containing protein [Pseudomonadota bacterium]
MKFKFFFIPTHHTTSAEDQLNAFVSQHAITDVRREYSPRSDPPGWSICITYEGASPSASDTRRSREEVDYRRVLSPEDFSVYYEARELRKQLAAEAGIPVYQVFTNKQLAEMVTGRVRSVTQLRDIAGVGAARVERYGEAFVALITRLQEEEAPDQ